MTSPKINLKKIDLSFIGPGATARPTSDYSENIFVKHVPYLGRIHFVRDQTGILSLSFIVFYWIYGTFTTYFIVLKPQYYDGEIPGFVINVFLSVSALCLVTLVRSALTNPGRVPLMAENVDADKSSWSDCKVCRRKRPLRAHHCRRCKQCVLRMDHHCPWINNCVGEDNHYMFVLLVFYAFLLSFLAFVFCQLHFWYFPKCVSCDREAIHIKHGILFLYLLTVMAFLMMAAMFGQMVTQHFNLLVDRTTLETIIADGDETDVSARGWLYAYKDLCGGGFPLFWLLPCRTRKSTAVYQYVNSV